MLAGYYVKRREWDRALTWSTAHVHDGVERNERDGQVGRVGRDALIAGAEYRVRSAYPGQRGTARTRLAFVARRGDIAEVWTTRALENIPADRCHVAHLTRRGEKERLAH